MKKIIFTVFMLALVQIFCISAYSQSSEVLETTNFYQIKLPRVMRIIPVQIPKPQKNELLMVRQYQEISENGQLTAFYIAVSPLAKVRNKKVDLTMNQIHFIAGVAHNTKKSLGVNPLPNEIDSIMEVEKKIQKIKLNNHQFMVYDFSTNNFRFRILTMVDKSNLYLINGLVKTEGLSNDAGTEKLTELMNIIATLKPTPR